MIKKTSIFIAVLTMLVFIMNQAYAFGPYPSSSPTSTPASPTPGPTPNTHNPPSSPTPTPTATATATPNTCGSNGDSWCNGKEPGDLCTIKTDVDGNPFDTGDIEGTCSSDCICEFCETCNDCSAALSDSGFIGASDSPDGAYDPTLSGSYRKMFKVTSSLPQIESDLRQLKESKRNKAYKKKTKFVRSYKENNDGTVSLLIQSKSKKDESNLHQNWLKFKIGAGAASDCTFKRNAGTAARPRFVADGCKGQPGKGADPCTAPCEKCQNRVSGGVVNLKCCECKLNPDIDAATAGNQAAQCSPDNNTPASNTDTASCAVTKGPGHKCDVAAGTPAADKCKCKCGNDDPCDRCETCNVGVDPNKCALKKGNSCGSDANFPCAATFNCTKNASGSACFCGCNANADCNNAGGTKCCQVAGQATKSCRECCVDGDCEAGTPKCCATTNKGQVHVCGNLNVDGCVPVAP